MRNGRRALACAAECCACSLNPEPRTLDAEPSPRHPHTRPSPARPSSTLREEPSGSPRPELGTKADSNESSPRAGGRGGAGGDCPFAARAVCRKLTRMGYRTLRACLHDLETSGQLLRIEEEIDPRLEAAEIHRRVFAAGGPAIYYARVKGCRFPMVSNLFGTMERMRFIFRDALAGVRRLVELKVDPGLLARRPWAYAAAVPSLWRMLPRRVSSAAVMQHETTIDQLPQLQSWPDDGGAFITLPQVYTEDVDRPGLAKSNLGMYRVQLSGGQYRPDRRSRAALPDSSRHRRASRGGDSPRRAACESTSSSAARRR